jgi:hypothetical protein
MMATKMPAKSLATSLIGPQEKPFSARFAREVRVREATVTADHDDVAQGVGEFDLGSHDRDASEIDRGAHENRADDHRDEQEVEAARHPHRLIRRRVGTHPAFLAVDVGIESEEHREHDGAGQQRLAEEMRGGPEEVDAAQEA